MPTTQVPKNEFEFSRPEKIKDLLNGLADDIATLGTSGGTVADYAALLNQLRTIVGELVTLANETKADLNLLRTDVSNLKTVHATTVTLANEAKADLNLLRADVGALKTAHAATVTLANELKTDLNALRTDFGQGFQAEAVAGTTAVTNIAVAAIAPGDTILHVFREVAGVLTSDLVAEATIAGAGQIQLGSTNTTGDALLVIWRPALTGTTTDTADTADSAALGSTDVAAADTTDSAALGSTAVAAANATAPTEAAVSAPTDLTPTITVSDDYT